MNRSVHTARFLQSVVRMAVLENRVYTFSMCCLFRLFDSKIALKITAKIVDKWDRKCYDSTNQIYI